VRTRWALAIAFLCTALSAAAAESVFRGFVADGDGGRYVVIGEEDCGPYEEIKPVTFAADGSAWAFWGLKGGKWYAVVGGEESNPYDEAGDLRVSPGMGWAFSAREGDGWRLTGEKLWIHNAPVADFALVLARTDPSAGHRGMSIFIVDLDLPGCTRGVKEHKMGQRASQVGALHFDAVRLPASTRLGEEGRGFHMMMSVLDKGRVGIGALAVGILQAALEESISYAKLRQQFGRPIAEFQAIQWMIADMAKDAAAARLLVAAAAAKIDSGERATLECSIAKCFASDAAVAHTANAVQIHGGTGYIRGVAVERLYRDAKITQIYEGTNQIQRMIIARQLLAD